MSEGRSPGRRGDPASRVAIDIVQESDGWPAAAARWSEEAARAAVGAAYKGGPAELAVALANDEIVKRLNRSYRDKDAPTNVLSFPGHGVTDNTPNLLGDVVLALETVAHEADLQGKTLEHHLKHLVVHGVLHLLGHDHVRQVEASEMENLERDILAGMGIADPYAWSAAVKAAAEEDRNHG